MGNFERLGRQARPGIEPVIIYQFWAQTRVATGRANDEQYGHPYPTWNSNPGPLVQQPAFLTTAPLGWPGVKVEMATIRNI